MEGTLPPVPDHVRSDLTDPDPTNDPGSAGAPAQPVLTTDSASQNVEPPVGAGTMQTDEFVGMPSLTPIHPPDGGADAPSPTAVPTPTLSTSNPVPPAADPLTRGDIRERPPTTPWADMVGSDPSGDIWPPREGYDFGEPRNMKHERHRPYEVWCVSTLEVGLKRACGVDSQF